MSNFTYQLYNWIVNFAIFYVLVCAAFYFLSNGVIFVPPDPARYEQEEHTLFVQSKGGETIAAVYHPVENSDYVILFSHGNAEDLGNLPYWIQTFNNLGYSFFGYDYPGYGLSTGSPTEDGVYDSIQASYDYLINTLHYKPEQIIVYGRSLGCAPSIKLASDNKVGKVILEAPFATAFTVITHAKLLPFDKFPNIKRINQINAPLLVIHGTKDNVIPFTHGKNVFDAAMQPKQFYAVENAGHNDIVVVGREFYWKTVDTFIKKTFKN